MNVQTSTIDGFVVAAAGLSNCGTYRYWLSRQWEPVNGHPKLVTFIMLNPSTADGFTDDMTIGKCIAYAKAWGYEKLHVCNLFNLRSKHPKLLYSHYDPIGSEGDNQIACAALSNLVVAAWGCHGKFKDRDKEVMQLLAGIEVYCLGTTKDGHPVHPLYQRLDLKPKRFKIRR